MLGTKRASLEGALESADWHDWFADSYARGAYAYVGIGGEMSPHDLARPIQDTLYFAGEVTAPDGHMGTVHGAIASGRRAAREIIESERKIGR
jgi:monoamine oxidase